MEIAELRARFEDVWANRRGVPLAADVQITLWREPKRATLTAFYFWLFAAFVAGAVAGAAVASAFSVAPSTAQLPSGASSALTSVVDGDPVRAGRMVEARAEYARSSGHETERSSAVHTGPAPSSTGPARVTAIDELPGSASVPLTTQASPDHRDPAAVLAARGEWLHGRDRETPWETTAGDAGGRVRRVSPQDLDARAHRPAVSADSARRNALQGDVQSGALAVLAAIDAAAAEFGHEPELMRIVAFCESSWDPQAIGDGGTSFGAWQFQMPTWRANVRRAGFAYSDADVFDPVASSRVAAWMWANGGELLWTCAR